MIRKHLPKDFITEYTRRKMKLDSAIEDVKDILSLRIGQLNGRKGTRCRLIDSRVKEPVKLWRNAQAKGYSIEDAFKYIEDLLVSESFVITFQIWI